jgi:hypothetical protein
MNSPVLNIVNSVLDSQINILYEPGSRIFDIAINDIDNINCFFTNDICQNYYYDMYFSNNILAVSDKKIINDKNHIKTVVAIHDPPPASFKKEDVIIFHNKYKDIYKIILGQDIANFWGFKKSKKTFIVDYGIPRISELKKNQTKNLLIFNLDNNPQIDLFYKNIKASSVNGIDIITKIDPNTSINYLISLISKYKVCMDYGNRENILYSLAAGVPCVTTKNFHLSNSLIIKVENFQEATDMINKLINNKLPEEESEACSQKIINDYDYDKFKTQIVQALSEIKRNEIFYYE